MNIAQTTFTVLFEPFSFGYASME